MKTISKLLFGGALVFATAFASKAQEVRYDVIVDDASEIKHTVNLALLDFDLSLFNFQGSSLNVGVWGHNQLFPKFFLEYKVRVGYLSWARWITKVDKDLGMFPLMNYDVGVNWDFFVGKNKTHNYKMILSSSRFGNYKSTTYFYAPGKTRAKIGLRGGFKFDHNQYKLNRGSLAGFAFSNNAGGPESLNYFNHSAFGFYVGLSIKSSKI